MTAAFSRRLMFLTLVLLSACGPEVKQPAPQSAPATAPPSTSPPPAVASPPTPESTPAPPAVAPPPAPTPTAQEAQPKVSGEVPQHVIVTVGRANLRENPDTKSKILRVLTKGTKLDVVSKGNQWYRVRMGSGTEGWVAESVVTPARPH